MIPFLGRLHPWEYLALLTSLAFLFLEGIIRIITLALPFPIINFFYRSSRKLFNHLSSPSSRRSRNRKKAIVQSIAHASDFTELCELFGYSAEEHIVQTKDGYLLGLHRLGCARGEEGTVRKKVVYLHHGLMMNSEVWVCLTEKERCLPFQLVDKGYDVWLGNNRGNKYSKKSTKYAPTEARFWAFSIDQFAFHDIPDSITYILSTTNQPSLSYVGFSQGTAQAFATLSIHPNLNDKVDVFVALAPAMSPPGLTSRLVNSLIKASPDFIFLAFGRRAILSSATMWEALLYPPIFVRFVDIGTHFLFGWHNQNMTAHQKLAAYPKLYSFTSTKSVVHWFQIIRNGKFQMYDDEMQGPLSISDTSKYYKVAKFPTRNIKTPIVMLYGGRDSLVNIGVMLKELPKHTEAREIAHYEHLDFLWASDVHEQVFPHVFEALERYAGGKRDVASQTARPNTPAPATGASNTSSRVVDDTTSATEDEPGPRKHTQNILHPSSSSSRPPAVAAKWPSGTRIPVPATSSPTTVSGSNAATDRTSTSRPEGWWSSDEVAGTEPSTPAKPSTSSVSSVAVPPPLGGASLALGTKGVGVGGVSGGKGERSDSGSSLMSGGGGRKRRKKRRGDEGDEE